MNTGLHKVEDILDALVFEDNICHECNKKTPSFNYCDPMYGGVFEQNYGWYINKQSFEYGVKPVSFQLLANVCPDEVFALLDDGKKEFVEEYGGLSEIDLIIAHARNSQYKKSTRKIRTVIENEVRVKFGFKKVGEAWATETLLYQLVCQILPDTKVIRHYRPEMLEGLELDVFMPNLNLGIEYQGIQHFKPISHWGGQKALKKVRERDVKKKKLCEKNGVRLIFFYHYEDLTRTLVETRIHSALE